MRTRTPLSSLLILALLLVGTAQAEIRYVKSGGSGAANGKSWNDATGDLQAMLSAAAAGDEIWVAAGTYTPNTTASGFTVVGSSVALYGGFPADATDGTSFTDRNPRANPTILSGDISGNDTTDVTTGLPDPTSMGDNVPHVLDIAGLNSGGMLVEGFTITGGNAANDPGYDGTAQCGGGIRVLGAYGYGWQFTLRNCEVRRNRAGTGGYSGADGGGVFVQFSGLLIENCTVAQNVAGEGVNGSDGGDSEWGTSGVPGGNGGGIAVWSAGSAVFDHVFFKENRAGRGGNGGRGGDSLAGYGGKGGDGSQGGKGGALSLENISAGVQILNCGFFRNQAGKAGNGGDGGNYTATDKSPGAGGAGAGSNAANGIASGCGGAVAMTYCNQGMIENSTFADNASGEGGSGGAPGSFTGTGGVNAQAGSSGVGGEGGALFVYQGAFNLLNCTFATNKAAGNGGALCFSPGYNGTLTGTHLTFANNTTDAFGGGVAMATNVAPEEGAPAIVSIVNSVFWGNLVSGSESGNADSDVWADYAGMAIANSVLANSPTIVAVVVVGTTADPQLKALSWNGGPNPTMAPQPGSPIIDATFLDTGQQVGLDQRGFPRDAAPDCGAFEVHQQAKSIAVSDLDQTTATLSWTPGAWGYSVVFIRPDDPADPKPRPADGWYYNPNPAFGTGGYITETPWSCVFAGTGNTVVVTGLSAGTKYSVMVCDTENSTDLHNTEDELGNPLVFETLSPPPPTLVFPVNCPDAGETGPVGDDPAYGHSLTPEPVFVWDPPANAAGMHFQVFLDDNNMIGNTAINPIGFRCQVDGTWTLFPAEGMPAGTTQLAFERAGGGKIVIGRSGVVLEHTWWVVGTDTGRVSSESSHFRFLSQEPVWENAPLIAGYTIIRAAQIEQLRNETNALRRLYGLLDYTFTDTLIANETPVRATHFLELRAAIAAAAAETGEDTTIWEWTDAVLTANATPVKAVHLEELRRALEGTYPRPVAVGR